MNLPGLGVPVRTIGAVGKASRSSTVTLPKYEDRAFAAVRPPIPAPTTIAWWPNKFVIAIQPPS